MDRRPPISSADTTPRLLVLPPSHYCERARWALDRLSIAYDEVALAVGPHLWLARRHAPRPHLPILVVGATAIQGSDAILGWLRLDGSAPAIESRLVQRTGVLVRRLLYAATLSEPDADLRAVLFDGVSPRQRRIADLLWPVTRRAMIHGMQAQPHLLPSLLAELEAELDWIDRERAGCRYLVGVQFGRADLTAASLLAPLARPAVACPLYRTRLSRRAEALLDHLYMHPTLEWVRTIYQQHRKTPANDRQCA